MEKKSRSVESRDFIEPLQQKPKSNTIFNLLTLSSEVTIYEVLRETKAKKEMGTYYRMEKTYCFKQRIMALYLLRVLLEQDGQSAKVKDIVKAIKKVLIESVKQFEQKLLLTMRSLEEREYEFDKNQRFKARLCALFDKQGLQEISLDSEDTETIVEMLVNRWMDISDVKDRLVSDMKLIYGRKLAISQVPQQQKITQLITCPSQQPKSPQKHLLYKHLHLSLSQTPIAQIIQTNYEQHIYFSLSFPPIAPPKSRISELFQEQDRTSVLESEGQNSESDSKSQIVKDDEFYRISSRILSSVRKDSFNSGGEVCEVMRSQRGLNVDNGRDGKLMDEKMLQFKSCLCNSLNPGAVTQNKPTNPVSQMYTRSSSLQKSNFLRKGNLSTSIDLLMRIQLQAQNRRKKSCQTIRTYQGKQTLQIESHLTPNPSFQGESQLRINLLNEDHASMFSGSFEAGEKEGLGRNNKRLMVARSFFRQHGDGRRD